MAEVSKILEGVFAISKPPSLSSAQVLRDLQQHFRESKTFAPLLAEVQQRYESEDRRNGKRRRRDPDSVFKMGHGGTLDPMATGVLIVGIGRGTKSLQNFLGCTKQYDTVVLFGKSTDTYDAMGKIVGEASFSQITKEKVEKNLAQFRGDIKQVPPIYSALKINGIKAYDYARSGKELPRELESRDMKVETCDLVEFYEGGTHDFRWPLEEAPEQEKAIAKKFMKLEDSITNAEHSTAAVGDAKSDVQDKKVEPGSSQVVQAEHIAKEEEAGSADTVEHPTDTKSNTDPKSNRLPPETKAALHTHAAPTLSSTPAPSPAVRISLVVSSGFYVRSFAHDLGKSLESLGLMAELTRSRQGDYILPSLASQHPNLTPTITYADLEAGEEKWGPLITQSLEKWMIENPLPGQTDGEGNVRHDDRDRDANRDRRWNSHRNRFGGGGGRDRNWNRNRNENRGRNGGGNGGGNGGNGSARKEGKKREREQHD